MATSDDVPAAWFGEPARGETDAARLVGFRPDVERALRGDLNAWADTVRGRVAMVRLLDQLARTCGRRGIRSTTSR